VHSFQGATIRAPRLQTTAALAASCRKARPVPATASPWTRACSGKDPCSGKRKRVDCCSSLVNEVTNQALHDEAQQIFALEGYPGVKAFRDRKAAHAGG
jgi:hypothetical protein